MNIKRLVGVLLRIALSVIFAGVFYTAWMAIGLPIFKSGFDSRAVRAGIWILAPIMTGLGFAVGPVIFELWPMAEKCGFWQRYKWSLAGCAIGGGITFAFGPMLIVFGMLAVGMVSVMLYEVRQYRHCMRQMERKD